MRDNILIHLTQDDVPYLNNLRPLLVGKVNGHLSNSKIDTFTEIAMKAKAKGCKIIATTDVKLLSFLAPDPGRKQLKINDYVGNIFTRDGLRVLILPPLEHLVTTPTGKFFMERWFSKILTPEKFLQIPDFNFSIFQPKYADLYCQLAEQCSFIAHDIETGDEADRVITCHGFSFVTLRDRQIEVTNVVIPYTDMYNIGIAQKILQSSTPKVTQNGLYDNSYLLRYGMPPVNWLGDTLHLFHSWYSEAPKRIDFIASWVLLDFQFWKDLSASQDLATYYEYNARDAFATGMMFLALLREMPQWAMENYYREFRLVFPCLMANMRGILRDGETADKLLADFENKLEARLSKLQAMTNSPNFNPSSPSQTVKLFEVLGSGDILNSKPASRDKVRARHPLNDRILSDIEDYRKDRKLVTSYLRDEPEDGEKNPKTWHGRIFFSLNPGGTDTSRLACKSSSFWCGWQIQNIPRDRKDIQIKDVFVADPGFYFGECDRSQAEARDTAYLSGDTALIAAVDDPTHDFHGLNASAFFGIPYSEIVESKQLPDGEWDHDPIDKTVRDLSKRTNHGANYNMGAQVMLDTMGIKKVIRAKKLLKLPVDWTLIRVCQYLLDMYAKTYPVVKGDWYNKVIADVVTTNKLVGPTGWTRYCFGKPDKNKRDLNRYVAHPPQSLNAQELNDAYMRVFTEVAIPEQENFRLGPQIHDSILFQYRIGRVDLAYRVQQCMANPIRVTDTFGTTRTLLVPTDLKGEATRWSKVTPMPKLKMAA